MNFRSKIEALTASFGISCVFALSFSLPANAVKPQCANPSNEIPLTKTRLNQIAAGASLSTTPEIAFERFTLRTIRPGNPVSPNNRNFRSPARDALEGIPNVEPDGVATLTVVVLPNPIPQNYNDSVFYESKAVADSKLPPGYEKSQILGFLDALGNSPAARAGENPAIIFLTTADVDELSPDTVALGSRRRIGVFHSIACELKNSPGMIRMGKAELTNPLAYLNTSRIPTGYGGPGAVDRLR
jgi:hypothetical protein